MQNPPPGREQLERDVTTAAGTEHVHQANVWVALGMVQEAHGLDERAALTALRRRATQHEVLLHEYAARLVSGQERP